MRRFKNKRKLKALSLTRYLVSRIKRITWLDSTETAISFIEVDYGK